MARSMLSLGMLWARAVWIALRKRGFAVGSPPPALAAIVISFESLLKIFPRFASIAPLKRLTFDHLLCPAISGFPDRDCLTSKIPKSTSRTADVRNYQAVLKPNRPKLSIQLSGPICGPFSGGGVEDLLPKAQR